MNIPYNIGIVAGKLQLIREDLHMQKNRSALIKVNELLEHMMIFRDFCIGENIEDKEAVVTEIE